MLKGKPIPAYILLLKDAKLLHEGAEVRFVEYGQEVFQPLNRMGYLPGVYTDPNHGWVTNSDNQTVLMGLEALVVKDGGLFVRLQNKPIESRKVRNLSDEETNWGKDPNVRRLYESPKDLQFASVEEELNFWGQNGVGERRFGEERIGFAPAFNSFIKGKVDVLVPSRYYHPSADDPQRYDGFLLHPCFAQHRERVRALTHGLYSPQEAVLQAAS